MTTIQFDKDFTFREVTKTRRLTRELVLAQQFQKP